MLKKRFAGAIIVKDNWAVQSFGFSRYLPIGKPEVVAENLDRWGADEILILDIDRSRGAQGPNIPLLKKIGGLGLSSPISYGGGVRDAIDAAEVIKCGAERVCIDTLLHAHPERIPSVSEQVGAQAVIASLPLSFSAGKLRWHSYSTQKNSTLDSIMPFFEKRLISEALLIDHQHEGHKNSFDENILKSFPMGVPLILFGGISEKSQVNSFFAHPSVIAVAVGNFLHYEEHAIQGYKEAMILDCCRPPQYIRS